MTRQTYYPTCCERNFPMFDTGDRWSCPQCGKEYRAAIRHTGHHLMPIWEYVEADHQDDVIALREEADRAQRMMLPPASDERALAAQAAAQLLEVHITTGINLRTFGAVGDFVDAELARIGRGPVTDNGS